MRRQVTPIRRLRGWNEQLRSAQPAFHGSAPGISAAPSIRFALSRTIGSTREFWPRLFRINNVHGRVGRVRQILDSEAEVISRLRTLTRQYLQNCLTPPVARTSARRWSGTQRS